MFIAKSVATCRQQSGWSSRVLHFFFSTFLYLVRRLSFGPLCKRSSCRFAAVVFLIKQHVRTQVQAKKWRGLKWHPAAVSASPQLSTN